MGTTASIGAPAIVLSPFSEKNALPLTLVNNSAGALGVGQEVIINADNSVTKRTTGAQFPIGTVKVGGAVGDFVTVETVFNRDLHAEANGGTLATGSFVRHNGALNADNVPQVVAAVATEYAMGIVLAGGAAGTIIRVGILRSPIKL